MTKDALSEYSATAASNTDIGGVNIDEGCPPSGINNAIREVMSHLKETDAGTSALTSPQITTINLGHASDTTIARSGAGVVTIEGVEVTTNTATQTLTNKTLTSAVLNTGVSGTAVKDEDDMTSNSATHLATQQSIKAYVDAQADNDTTYSAGAGLDLNGTTFSVESDLRSDVTQIGVDTNDYYVISATAHNWYLDGNNDMRLENDGDLHCDGNIIAYSTTISDPRLKENIEPIEDALGKVNKLNGYTFTYKSDGKKSAGILSTEVSEVLPSAVSQSALPVKLGDNDKTEYDVVMHDQLHALLIESIKELSQRVKDLEMK